MSFCYTVPKGVIGTETLEILLEEESKTYRCQAAFIRAFTSIRGLDKEFPLDHEVALHMDSCKEYYELYGTKDGKDTPWVTGRRA